MAPIHIASSCDQALRAAMNFGAGSWTAIATAVAAWVALILSLLGLRVSARAQRLAERQEARRRPGLAPYLRDGYARVHGGARIYGFLLSVSNPTDCNNAVAGIDLHVTYTAGDGLQMTVKLPADSSLLGRFPEPSGPVLPLPARIDAHQTATGWVYFRADRALLRGVALDRYVVVLVDSHGLRTSVEPIVVREYADETKTAQDANSNKR